jgi:hypothetical protein
VGYYSTLKGNELLNQEKTQRRLKCIFLLSKESEKDMFSMIPANWLSGKGKTVETVRSVLSRGWMWG